MQKAYQCWTSAFGLCLTAVGLALLTLLALPVAASAGYKFAGKWGSKGSAQGQFEFPRSVAVDRAGNVYVTERGPALGSTGMYNGRVQKFSATGKFVTEWGSWGSGDGQLDSPSGIATDRVGNVYVTDEYQVHKFTSDGTLKHQVGRVQALPLRNRGRSRRQRVHRRKRAT